MESEKRIWCAMRQRCRNPNNPSWRNYGGRGITICARWDRFANFYADMGPRPSPTHSIDRINNDGNYEPGNCRWATPKQQARNTRRNANITLNGVSRSIGEWAEVLGVPVDRLHMRKYIGYATPEEILGPRRLKVNEENAAKTHCIRGHAFTVENTHHYFKKGFPARRCRACAREYRHRAAKAAAAS